MIDRLESFRIQSVYMEACDDGTSLVTLRVVDDATNCTDGPHVLVVQFRLNPQHLILEFDSLTRERADGVAEVYDFKTRLVVDGHTKPLEGKLLRKVWWE